jgi:hypothetical protein
VLLTGGLQITAEPWLVSKYLLAFIATAGVNTILQLTTADPLHLRV